MRDRGSIWCFFFFQAEDGIRDIGVTGVQTCALPIFRFYHHESCGQCTPCREGSGWLEKIMAKIYRGQGKADDFERLFNVATQMSGTTICLLADSVAMPTGASVIKFREEFQYFCKNGKSMVAEKFGSNVVRL